MKQFLRNLLLLCLIQYCISFGMAGSEIRSNRAPITCFNSESTRRYNSSSSNNSEESSKPLSRYTKPGDVQKDDVSPELLQNTKYVNGLIETLGSLLDKWVESESMATRRRAYNLLQQIERISLSQDLVKRAEKMVNRSGMPMDAPPPIPPTEHIPAIDQQQTEKQPNNVIKKHMGTMGDDSPMGHAPKGYKTSESYDMNVGSLLNSSSSSSSSSSNGNKRKSEVSERLEWEQKHREKSEFMNRMKENVIEPVDRKSVLVETGKTAPRSALSARMANGKGGDPILSGIVEGDGLDPFTFAEDKQKLQNTMNDSSDTASTSDVSNNVQQAITSEPSIDKAPSSTPEVREIDLVYAAKSSEFIARAGSGDAFLGSVLGVGGLDDVLSQIKRRVWIPLAAPPSLLSELGIQPVRGLLLYGSPGCGKTLLARKLGSILSPCRPITIVSGPEILDKFVGSSEKNLREIFDNPPDLYHEYKKNYGEPMAKNALHVIVLDEFDAIARRRGGSGGKGDQGDAGVARDSVVNQLLAKMDGVEGLGVPTLLVGLTNKPSLIDAALMRPGRFEVQIEVPPPQTVEQRIAILKVHCNSMVENGRVLIKDAPVNTAAWKRLQVSDVSNIPTYDELLDIIAVECDGMSGASLAGVARAAASRALERAVTDFAGNLAADALFSGAEEGNSISDCLVTQEDFEKAIEDVFESAKSSDYSEETDSSSTSDEIEEEDTVDDDG